MKRKILSLLLSVMICLPLTAQMVAHAAEEITPQQVYQAIISLKNQYPEGMSWTNDNYYEWQGGIYSGGHGCAGFAFMLSDAAFDELPARMNEDFAFTDVQVGDILRINNDTHSVIVLEVNDNSVMIAEGNYNKSVHWGRTLTKDQVLSADFMITRYPDPAISTPDDPSEPNAPETPSVDFTDVAADAFYAAPVVWAVEKGITTGTGNNQFSPSQNCTNAQILTFIWRAYGKPEPTIDNPFTNSIPEAYAKPAIWAYEKGMVSGAVFDANTPCTRAMAATYLWQAAGSPTAPAAGFTDVPANAAYAQAVAWAVEQKVTTGTGTNIFSPDVVCNRGQIVTFLHRAFASDTPEA